MRSDVGSVRFHFCRAVKIWMHLRIKFTDNLIPKRGQPIKKLLLIGMYTLHAEF